MEIIPRSSAKKNTRAKRKRENVKVVYISSPVKVKTSASRFRALVQELTGQDSDVSRFVETNTNGAADAYNYSQTFLDRGSSGSASSMGLEPHRDSPASSESFLENFDDVLISSSRVEDSFLGMFPSNFSFDAPEFDVLGEYGSL